MQTGSWFEPGNKFAILVFWVLTTLYEASFWASLLYLDILQQVTDLLPTSVTSLLELAELQLDSDFSSKSAGFLFYKAFQSANKASERADKADGY